MKIRLLIAGSTDASRSCKPDSMPMHLVGVMFHSNIFALQCYVMKTAVNFVRKTQLGPMFMYNTA